ncbi:MAG TPA: hypothetical protein VIK16_06210 [Candidatus Limnocylindrales bacterium]
MIAPDPIARDYLLLALRLDRLVPGLVDGYFGPAALRAQVDAEGPRPPSRLREDAAELRARVEEGVFEPDRRRWLTAQIVALETQARALEGDGLAYVDHVSACFDFTPERIDEGVFAAAAAELERLLPGAGSLAERTAAWDARFTIPPDRLRPVIDALLPGFRERARTLFGLPAGENLTVSLVRDQPWSGYNWYDGGLRSRVEINTDLPTRAADLLSVLPHETYPGHHLEHAWHEAHLVATAGRLEASVLCINAPECLLSEGLADLGRRFAVPTADEADLLVEVYRLAGLEVARDPAAARGAAAVQVAITRATAALGGVRGNAALLRHADGATREEVVAYLERYLLTTPDRAAKRLEFIEHPLWRTYVFVYFEGERLLSRWLERVPPADQAGRFRRLLTEQLTPGAILAEIAESTATG